MYYIFFFLYRKIHNRATAVLISWVSGDLVLYFIADQIIK